ncbi:type II secretion system F family protein [Ramlibacter sp. PS4R-6]|uniref:type II secretion system F family protein n=1 Tax=Ramlibacter sp. PS4R-6 TaxID=3133438 RepID=UPI0030A67F59
MNLAGNSFLVLAVLVFVALLLFFESGYLFWTARYGAHAVKLQGRLAVLGGTRERALQTQLLRERMLSDVPAVQRVLGRFGAMHAVDRYIRQSGLDWTVGKLVLSMAALAAIAWLAVRSQLGIGWLPALTAAAVAAAAPFLFVSWRRQRRLRTLQRQLPDALDLLTRALRAGHSFSAAMKMASEEMPQPTAGEFRMVHDEVNFGVSLERAFTHLAERVPLTDLRYFVVAVLVQRESGGNLTEILGNLGRLVRERLKLYARIRVLSSEGRLSAWVLGLLPFALAALMNIFNPAFMNVMWRDPIGITITQYLLVLMAVGIVVLVKIVRIRV